MNAEKESNPKNVAQKKDQRQAAVLPFSLRETENANSQTQDPDGAIKEASVESKSPLAGNENVPAVHGSDPAYSDGSEKMHRELQSSLEKKGGLDHPDTIQAEKDYKSTLGISELRDYNDIKSGTYIPKNPEAKATATIVPAPAPVIKNDAKAADKTVAPVEAAVTPEAVENQVAVDKTVEQQPPAEGKQDVTPAVQPKKQATPSPVVAPKGEAVKQAKETKQVKISNTGKPGDLLTSLANAPVTELVSTFNAVQTGSTAAFNNLNKETANGLPKLNEAQGSAYGQQSKLKNNSKPNNSKSKTAKKTVKGGAPKKASKATAFPEKEPLKKTNYTFKTGGNKNAPIDKQAQNQFDEVRLNTSAIPTRMKESSNLELTGDASIENLAIEQQDVSQDVTNKKNNAARDIHKDYGENSIIKKPGNEILKSKHKLKNKNIKANPIKEFKTEGIDATIINANFGPVIHSKIGEEKNKYDVAQIEHDQNVFAEEKAAETKIENEKGKSKDKQLKSVKEAQGDVNKSRGEWQTELDKTEADFERKAGNQAKTTMGKIQTEKTAGEAKAQAHINKANDDAQKEKQKADQQAEKEKANKKKESGGFLGWLADKASAFINALKEALNVIFTKLRQAVKAIFELAKKLMLEALEFARKLIVGFIKAFAVILKGFLDVALAAFPEIRDRLKAKIDHYVTVAEKYVNQAFDMFKSAVTAIMDFLAETVDKLLGLVQSIYEGILTVADMIVKGEIGPLLAKLGNIKDALFAITFDTIKQGGMEELLGADLDKSLEPEELMAAMQMGLISGGSGQDSDDGMPKAPWTNENVGVDVVSFEELAPEMQAELRRMQKAGQTEALLGERNDPTRTMSSVMEEAHSGKGQEASGEKFNDGLTPMKRAEIKWELMKTGIKQWWDENWLKVVGGIIAALVVFIAAEVVTGGAITAAIPVIMPILADVFIGVTIATLAGYFADGLSKAWNGEIRNATKAFSRGLGAALIELAMYLGFKLVEVAGKAITQFVKGGIKMAKAGAKSVMNFGKFIIEKGKVLFKGVAGKNLGKLNKSLRKLADDILERMRVRKVFIKIEGKLWKVQAEINPLFTIISGPMPNEELYDLVKKDKGEIPKGLKKGETFIDDQGRELMKISDLDEFTKTPNYREIFALAYKKDISGDVIHHLIEKGSDFAYLFEKELINAPKSLRAIPKGNINDVLHLSDIRVAWDETYKLAHQILKEGGTTDNVKSLILDFAAKTDDFISKSLTKIAQQEKALGPLSKEQIGGITNEFKYLLK